MSSTPWDYRPEDDAIVVHDDETICEACNLAYYAGLPVCSVCHGDRYSLIVPATTTER